MGRKKEFKLVITCVKQVFLEYRERDVRESLRYTKHEEDRA